MLPRISVKNAGPGSLEILMGLWHRQWYASQTAEAHHRYRVKLLTTPWARKHMQVLVLEENGAPLSGMIVLTLPITLNGRKLKVAGIAAVVTDPEQRGRGLAARLIAIGHRRLADAGHHAGMLWTEIGTAYYAKMGYVTWPLERRVMSVPAVEPPAGLVVREATGADLPAMRALYDATQAGYAMRLEKPLAYWRHMIARANLRAELFGIPGGGPAGGRCVAVQDDAPLAYARFWSADGVLTVSEAAHAPGRADALAALFTARARAGGFATLAMTAPAALVEALGLPVREVVPVEKLMLAPLDGKTDVTPVPHYYPPEDAF